MKKYHATILVVEDNADDQFFITRSFREIGVKDPIHVVNNGAEALAYMKGEGKYSDRKRYEYPTFVSTDLKMPVASGLEVLAFLKAHPDWAIIPTIVLTSSTDPDDIKKAYRLGASSYHVKPSDLQELRNQLKVVHDYWCLCEVPAKDIHGKQLPTHSDGKLGELHTTPLNGPDARN